jgi:hypothetical protein
MYKEEDLTLLPRIERGANSSTGRGDRLGGSRRRLIGQDFWVARDVVWWPGAPEARRERLAVVSVSYNTRELTGFLLWSLRKIVNWPGLEIVIVDNGSRDGSAELLAEAGRAGVCALLANDVNRGHGPGLNQGISWLASRPGSCRNEVPSGATDLPVESCCSEQKERG